MGVFVSPFSPLPIDVDVGPSEAGTSVKKTDPPLSPTLPVENPPH